MKPTDDEPVPATPAVIGASAGGLAALQDLLAAVPATFAGTVCIVMHLAPERPSHLGRILARDCALPVTTAEDGEVLQPGHVYVAPPDRHLLVDGARLRLDCGPKEHGHRPGIDALFRSAARTRGPETVGIVLTGSLHDGADGLGEIQARGGRTAIQDPADAAYDSMPLAALNAVKPDFLGTAAEIGAWLGHPA